jgi:uncharacterized membrane protein
MKSMDKNSFLKRLDDRLRFLAEAERKDILYDYEEHINAAIENGEDEAKVIEKLGSPELIARQFNATQTIKNAEQNKTTRNMLSAVAATMGLGFVNLIFVVGPFFGLLGCLIGFYGAAFGLTLGGLVSAAVGMYGLLGGNVEQFIHLGSGVSYNVDVFSMGVVGLGICLASIGGLIAVFSIWATRWFYKGTIAYLKMNLNVIKGEPVGQRK